MQATPPQATPSPATSAPRAWQSVLTHIEGRLLAGDLAPGDRLPPERLLATDLGVGRSSVRGALRVLEVLGLIRTGTGSGPASGAIVIARPSGGMATLMRLQVAGGGFAVADVVATRLVLEAAVVTELAADEPDQAADLAPAAELLDAMDLDLTEAEFLALDAAFHLALAEASGNSVITAMMSGLRNSVERYALAGAAFLPSWSETSTRLRAEHRGILAAVENRDAPLARTLVRDHISGYYAEMTPPPLTTAPTTRN
ncbi:MAG: FadR family transcriptional regulator [Burkholderiaceae bacterium]|nr:FadR family transcriptional regulator [Microbacteriaceae bacterium]